MSDRVFEIEIINFLISLRLECLYKQFLRCKGEPCRGGVGNSFGFADHLKDNLGILEPVCVHVLEPVYVHVLEPVYVHVK